MHRKQVVDYLIVGAGVIGLSIARALRHREPSATITILEKEPQAGLHSSGRNSGVLHSGIYYPEHSLKAKVCVEGAHLMHEYCLEHQLPINKIGKIIVPTKETDKSGLQILLEQAKKNGVAIELIDDIMLRKMEPETQSATGSALFLPSTSVVDPKAILNHLVATLIDKSVNILYCSPCLEIDTHSKKVTTPAGPVFYGHLFNAAGLYADKIAQQAKQATEYTMLPFKGIYHQLKESTPITINHLIYPVPDLNMPFLGIHFTKSISGAIYVGPSAFPALGRENYKGIKGIKLDELTSTIRYVSKQYFMNQKNFRGYSHAEIPRTFMTYFLKAAQQLVPNLNKNHLVQRTKIGIRAQLYDKKNNELIVDFLISRTNSETHVLNAVSPAFTSSFSLAKLITSTQ